MKSLLRIIVIVCCCLWLYGCGFHLRSAGSIPPQLHTLYLGVEKPDQPFNSDLRNLLESLQIDLVQSPEQAPLTLNVSYAFDHSVPTITSSTQSVTYNYSLKSVMSIQNQSGETIVPEHSINLSRQIVLNTSEIYTPNTANLVKQELQRDVINLVYYWLTNSNTQEVLAAAESNHYHPVPKAKDDTDSTSDTTGNSTDATTTTTISNTP